MLKTTMPIPTKFYTTIKTTNYASCVVQAGVQQIQDGGRPPSWKIEKWPNPRNGLTDWHKIWHNNVHWPSEVDRPLKFQTFKNARLQMTTIFKNQKWPCIRNGVTNRHEIWHSGTYWPSKMDQPLKFVTFNKLAPYGTGGRLLLTANFKVTW